jgi:hypothetical protein
MRNLALILIICSVGCSVFGAARKSADVSEIDIVSQLAQTWSNPHFQAALELAKELKSKDQVEVKESTIAGASRGLFAKKNIRAGAIVALYTGELVHNIQLAAEALHPYIMRHIDIDGYMIVGSSGRGYEPCLLASLANDPFVSREDVDMLKLADISKREDLEKVVEFSKKYLLKYIVYVRAEMKKRDLFKGLATIQPRSITISSPRMKDPCNSLFTPFITNRSIKKGEEIFFAYGLTYWVENLARKLAIYKGNVSATAALDIEIQEFLYNKIKLPAQIPHTELYSIPDRRRSRVCIEEQYKKEASELLRSLGTERLKQVITGMYFPFAGDANVSLKNFADTKHRQLFLGLISNLQKAPASEFYDHRGMLGPHPQALELLDSCYRSEDLMSGIYFTAHGRDLSLTEAKEFFTRHQSRR